MSAIEERGAGDGSAAQDAKDQAKQAAGQARGQAREKLREQVDQRTTQAGERVGTAVSDVRTVAEELRRQGKDKPAEYAEQAAGRAERLGSYLKDSDGDTILRDVEDFARSKPWAVAAGGVALGFVASRLLKASSTERYRRSTGPDYATRTQAPAATPSPPTVPTEPGTPVGAGRV
jgi:hypothetical protein